MILQPQEKKERALPRNVKPMVPQEEEKKERKQNEVQSLQHFVYSCPGLNGKGARLVVEPRAFEVLFSREAVEIPLFQRRYCWTTKEGEKWWKDTVKTSTNPSFGQGHRVGKIVFKKREQDGSLVCIDGQQRITTTSLLLASLRDAVLQELFMTPEPHIAERLKTLLTSLNRSLFIGPAEAQEWINELVVQNFQNLDEKQESFTGLAPSFLFLRPSYFDRGPFLELITAGAAQFLLEQKQPLSDQNDRREKKVVLLSEAAASSHQGRMYQLFSREIQQAMKKHPTPVLRAKALTSLFKKSLAGLYFMYVEILNEISMPQVFLWMQEKSLFGEGAHLVNNAPGVTFDASDLVRNLLMAPIMNESLTDQEKYHLEWWLQPIEMVVRAIDNNQKLVKNVDTYLLAAHQDSGGFSLDKLFVLFLQAHDTTADRHVGPFEQTLVELTKSHVAVAQAAGVFKADVSPIALYSRFHSYYDFVRIQTSRQLQHEHCQQRSEKDFEQAVCEAVLQELADFAHSLGSSSS